MLRRLLADRNTRLFLIGETISTMGDSALLLAAAVWVKMLTGSAPAAGMALFMYALGSLTGPLGGVLIDRVRRRPLLIAGNLATAVLVLVLLFVRDHDQVWLIYLVMVGYGVSGALLGSGQVAMLKTVVPDELLGDANGLVQTLNQGLRLVTPLLGVGLLTAFGPVPVIIGDAVTFLVAVGMLLALRVREQRPERGADHWLAEAVAGARHIRRTAVLRQVSVAGVLAMIGFGFAETVLFVVVEQVHEPDAFVGTLVSLQGVGAVAAGLVAAPLMRRLGERGLVALGMIAFAICFVLFAVPLLGIVIVAAVTLGACLPWIIVGVTTALQRRTPSALVGRANSALNLALSVPQTLAIALGASLVAVLDHRLLLLGMAALGVAAAGYLGVVSVREHRHLPSAVAAQQGGPGDGDRAEA